jgi:hypothetical protein
MGFSMDLQGRLNRHHRISLSSSAFPSPTVASFMCAKRRMLAPISRSLLACEPDVHAFGSSPPPHASTLYSRTSLPNFDESGFPDVFQQNVEICKYVFLTFTNLFDRRRIDRKTNALQELRRSIVTPGPRTPGLSDRQIALLFEVITVNIIRFVRVDPRVGYIGDTTAICDPASCHLSLVYPMMLDLFKAYPNDSHF